MFINWREELTRNGHRIVLSGIPTAMHCHHYNINLQKMLEDTLGNEGIVLMFRSAEEAGYKSFCAFIHRFNRIRTVKSKLEFASTIFQHCGLGIIHFQDVSENGGSIVSPSSHHVTGWLAKFGRRQTPGCHFSRGWIAGVLAAIFDRPLGFYDVEEQKCKTMRDEACIFVVKENEIGH